MRNAWFIIGLIALCWSAAACSAPGCIECAGIDGYPNGRLCQDTYETTLTDGSPDWRKYSGEALEAGCTAAE